MAKFSSVLIFIAGVFGCVSTASAAYQTITNDVWWLDNNGKPIMAQAGGITKVGNTYYWYGIQYPADASYYKSQTGNTIASGHGINCYSSTDLAHWTFVNTLTTNQSTGRMGEIAYNSADNQYVIWANDGDGTPECYTGSTLTGSYSLFGTQAVVTNVYTGGGTQITGDCTLFIDVDKGGTPYFITSDPHGREHAYVCPLSPNYLIIGDATLISEWPQGQEGNNMFERNGVYYYIMSNLAGYSYSTAYAIWSTNILTPGDYTVDAPFQGTTADNTRYSQVSFGFRIAGTLATNYIYVGDRWCEEDSTYASAGYGSNFSVFCPVTFTNNVPYFNSMHMFQIDTVTGLWRTATPANIPTNLIATASGGQVPGQVELSWAAMDGATAYNLKRSTTNGGPYTTIASLAVTNYTDNAVTNGTTYFYAVSSTNSFGESANSAQVNATPSIGPLITTASATPNPAYPGQVVTISATVTADTNPVAAVTVNAGAIGGLTNQALVSDGAGNYTNSVTVGVTPMVGFQTLLVNASDNLGNLASPYPLSLTIESVYETWDGGGGDNNWSDAANWAGDVAPGNGYSLIFAGATRLTPNMDNSYSINGVIFSNTAASFVIGTANSAILTLTGGVTNNSANTETLNVPISLSATQTFDAASGSIAISGVISDAGGGLAEAGNNMLILSGVNTYTGNTIIGAGALQINNPGQLNSGAYGGNITDDGAFIYNSTAAQSLSGTISGTGKLTNNAGTLTLSGANTYSGGTTVSGGTLNLNTGATSTGENYAGTGVISLAGGTLLVTSTANSPNTIITNAVTVIANSTLALSSGGNNQAQFTGNVSGNGTLSLNIPSGDIMNVGGAAGQYSGFTGTLEFGTSAGEFKVRTASNLNLGNAVVNLGSGSAVILSKESGIGNTTQTFGAIMGGTGTELEGPDSSGAAFTYNVGGLNTSAEFDGIIANGSGTTVINKIGAGTWTLTHANTYTGNTTVSNGTLLVNGSLAAGSAVVVASGGTLGGTGTINGAVTVNGTIAPGTSIIGTLTLGTAPVFNGTNLMAIDRNGGSPLADKLVVSSGTLTYGGTLMLTNQSTTPLVAGDSFKLFNAAGYGGSFASMILPALNSGLAWNTGGLNTNGTVSVAATAPPAPPVIRQVMFSGTNFSFSSTGGVAGATLYVLTSTNLTTPLSNWTRLLTNQFDTNGNFNFTNTPNTNHPQSFYLLLLQ